LRRNVTPGKLLDDGLRVVLPADAGESLGPEDWIITLGLQRARINERVEAFDIDGKPATTAAK
jgi:hypothetical protein